MTKPKKSKFAGVFGETATPETETAPDAAPVGRVVRESFTAPEPEHAVIEQTRQRLMRVGLAPNRSEIVRMALVALAALDDATLERMARELPKVKPGPKKGESTDD